MMKKGFKELDIWKSSIKLSIEVCKLISKANFKNNYFLMDQIRRSSISLPSNIAEGFDRGGDKEFIRFLYIAKASASELLTQLIIAAELDYISDSSFKEFDETITVISRRIGKLIVYLKSKSNV